MNIVSNHDFIARAAAIPDLTAVSLARLAGFTEEEMKLVEVLWEPAFNGSWIYVTKELIEDFCGYSKGKDMYTNFLNRVVIKNGTEEEDYKFTGSNGTNLCSSLKTSKDVAENRGGSNKRHCIVSGEFFKHCLMVCDTTVGKYTRRIYIKLESLALAMVKIVSLKRTIDMKIKHKKDHDKFEQKLQEDHDKFEQKLQEDHDKFDQERQEFQRRELRLKDFIDSTKQIEKLQIIYTGTSDVYERQNRYKVGGCKSLALLEPRFSTYNSRSSGEDPFFCTYYRLVHDYTDIEKRISTLLAGFKDTRVPNKEMYHIHGSSLRAALDFIINNADRDVEWFNENLPKFIQCTVDAPPCVSAPLILGRKTLSLTAGDRKVDIADITGWSPAEVDAEITAIFAIYKERKSLADLTDKIVLWREFAEIIKERHKGTPMQPWRLMFKEGLPRRSERLRLKWTGKLD